MVIRAAADGSAFGNPGPTGWAWYVDPTCWAAGGSRHGTNNIGELTAVLELLRATEAAGRSHEELHILCDSQYVINSVTKWMPGWKRKGWKKADGKPVLNVDLMKSIDAAMTGRSVRFEWVKGHAGHPLNEAADERARAAATAFQNGTTVSHGPGFGPTAGEDGLDQGDLFSAWDDPGVSAHESIEMDSEACMSRLTPREAERGLIAQAAALGVGGRIGPLVSLLADDPLLIDHTGAECSPARWQELWGRLVAGQASAAMTQVSERALGPDARALTYVLEVERARVRVSSVWVSTGSDMLLAFHQWGRA